MSRRLRWTRPLRAVADRFGWIRDRSAAAARSIERWLDGEGRASFDRSGAPGLAVVVRFADGREITRWLGTSGGGAPVRPETRFPVLSLSKPVTAMLALGLVEDGVLSLDEPVWRRLRSWRLPPLRCGGFDADGVTLRRILSHDAGFDLAGFGWVAPGTNVPARALADRESDSACALRLIASPGTGLRYSGSAFAIVELLVEEATGRPFPEVARARLLAPLGIVDSGFEPALSASPRLATGHDLAGRPIPPAGLASTASAGFVATARDVATLWSLPTDGRGILSPASRAAVLTPHATDARGATCGLGFYVKSRRRDVKYMHLGYDVGWNLVAEGLLHRGAVVVLLANGDRGRDCVPAFAVAIRERLYEGLFARGR